MWIQMGHDVERNESQQFSLRRGIPDYVGAAKACSTTIDIYRHPVTLMCQFGLTSSSGSRLEFKA